MRRSAPLAAAALAVAALLAGCSAEPAPAPTASASEPSATAPAAPSSTPAPTASAPAEAVVPEECEAIPFAPGGSLTGTELGPCLQAVVARHDTGTLTLSGAELAGTVSYHYDPMFEFRGDLETGDGPVSVSFVDGELLLDTGDGPVVGNVESTVPEEQMAGATGELYRVFSDPGFMGDLIGASESWSVSATTESVSLPDGTAPAAYRIDSAEPFAWYDIPIDAYSVWVTEEWMPVAAESTSAFLGRTTTITQQFTGLGEPVRIEPLS